MNTVKNILFSVIGLYTLLLSHEVAAQEVTQELKDVDEIISRYYEAIGGYDQLKAVKTKIIRGTYVEPGYGLIMNGETISIRGDKRLARGTGELIGYFYEGYNGEQVWEYYKGDTIPRIMDGEAEKASRRGAEFDDSFVDYREKGHKVELQGLINLEGSEVYQINVTLSDGWEKVYYIDSRSFLVKAMRKSMPLHARGDDINFLVFFDQYRPVAGVLYPFVHTERNIDDNFKMINVFIKDEILINPNIDTVNFDLHIPVLPQN